jgi:hypothetical protein
MSTTVQRQAAKDAEEYARAHMSYGEGAGNRRKLIYGTVDYKMATIPGYREAFQSAAARQNMAKYAKEAERSNRRRTINTAVARNTRAIVSGRYENVNSVLLIGGAAVYFAHRYEIDKVIIEKTKKKYRNLKNRLRRNKISNITVL